MEPMLAAARENGEVWALSPSAWTIDEIPGPNVTDKETVLTFARMAANAYAEKEHEGDWKDVLGGYNRTEDFGWESDGLRGHIYGDETNKTIVIGLKGTSVAVFDGADTTTNDKENDNLFFSCCCGQQGQVSWRQVCDCATGTYTCNNTCVTTALRQEHRYYQAARHLYSNVTALYPDSNIWVVGHSLGGAVSGLLGLTYGLPAITFQAVPEAMAAGRLGLPTPPGARSGAHQTRKKTGIYHFGHTADPIYMGSCNGYTSVCTFAGYAMESQCHAGKKCVYDVVADKGWRVGAGTHKINYVIKYVIGEYEEAAICEEDTECYDCYNWKYFEGNESTTTTTLSSSSTKTRTRTETCKTPGWWGCLDETTTSPGGTSSGVSTTTTTSSTSTCKTPGWFGCNDEVTTTTSSSSKLLVPTATKTSKTLSSSTTCTSPGFFGGCNDPTSTSKVLSTKTEVCETPGFFGGCQDASVTSASLSITSPPAMPTISASSTGTKTHECLTKEWFGFICVDPSPDSVSHPTSTSVARLHGVSNCLQRNWLGKCRAWAGDDEINRDEV